MPSLKLWIEQKKLINKLQQDSVPDERGRVEGVARGADGEHGQGGVLLRRAGIHVAAADGGGG